MYARMHIHPTAHRSGAFKSDHEERIFFILKRYNLFFFVSFLLKSGSKKQMAKFMVHRITSFDWECS